MQPSKGRMSATCRASSIICKEHSSGPGRRQVTKPREMPRHLPLGPRSREAKTPFRQQIGATATMPHLGPFKFSAEVPEQGAGTDAAERGTATPGLEGDRPEKEQETFRLRRIPPSVLGPVLDNRMRCAYSNRLHSLDTLGGLTEAIVRRRPSQPHTLRGKPEIPHGLLPPPVAVTGALTWHA